MEFVLIDSCTLITSSNFWEGEVNGNVIFLREKKFRECEVLFDLFENHKDELTCIITRTVEIEANTALDKAVNKLLKKYYWKIKDLQSRYNYSTLKSIIKDISSDRMGEIIDKYSTRPPMDKKEVNKILRNEIEPFFVKIIPETCRYYPHPKVISRLKGPVEGKREILNAAKNSIFYDKIIYIKGDPEGKDKLIMAEATYICRVNKKKTVYIASLDYDFIPNPTSIDSFKSALHFVDYEHMDSRMRDLLHKEFGFFGARPKELLEIFETQFGLK